MFFFLFVLLIDTPLYNNFSAKTGPKLTWRN